MGLFDGFRRKALAGSLYNQGNDYMRQDRFEEAIEAYMEALSLNPNFVDAHYNVGIAYGAVGQLEKAVRECKEVIKLDPDHIGAYYNLGVNYADQGKLQEAIESYEAFIRLAPSQSAAQIRQAEDTIHELKQLLVAGSAATAASTWQSEEASEESEWCTFEDGAIPYPDPEHTVFFEGIEYGKRITFDEEEQLYIERATRNLAVSFTGKKFHKDDAKTLWCETAGPEIRKVIKSRLGCGDTKGALSTCMKLVAACPEDPADWNLLAEVVAKQGEHTNAKACLNEAKRRQEIPPRK